MPFMTKAWNLETKIEHLNHLANSLKTEAQTAHLVAPLTEVLSTAEAALAEKKRLRMAQLEALCKLNALDRKLDIQAAALSTDARQAERINPALRVLGTLFPDGVAAVTKYSGRGVETQLHLLKGVLMSIDGMPEAEILAPIIVELRATIAATEAALAELIAIDDQVDANDRYCDDIAERIYNAYYATKGELTKIFFNNRRFIATFFLN